jgi:hypothetical protein
MEKIMINIILPNFYYFLDINKDLVNMKQYHPEYFKTDNFTARKIAKWCNKYITPLPKNQKQPMIFDWHFWSINY